MRDGTRPYQKNLKHYLILSGVLFILGFWSGNFLTGLPGQTLADQFNSLFNHGLLELLSDQDFQFLYVPTSSGFLFALIGGFSGLIAYVRNNNHGVYRNNEEHGSARLARPEEIGHFADLRPENNIIYTQKARMGLINQAIDYRYQKNKNVVVLGGPGSGKTYTFVKPNLMQLLGSYIVTDPKGLLVRECGKMLEENGYQVKIFDLVTFLNSDRFNIFHYLEDEMDVDRIFGAISEATKKGDNQSEDFWQRAEGLLARAMITFLWIDGQDNDYTPDLGMVSELFRHIERKEAKVPSVVEEWMEEQNARHPNNYAYKQWTLFNDLFKAETRSSALALAATRFSVFDHEKVVNLIAEDTMDIDSWNEEKTAVFLAIPETDDSYNFIAAMFLSTVMERLRKKVDEVMQGIRTLPEGKSLLHVRFILDEFANIGRIPNIDKALATFRSREMSIVIILQALAQLKAMYKNGWETLLNSCDSLLFLGGDEKETTAYLSQRAGKQTISIRNRTQNHGRTGGSTSYQKQARDLFTPDEIGRLNNNSALLFISGQYVFKDKKYTVDDHPNASLLAQNPQDPNWYRYKRYMDEEEEFLDKATQIIDHGAITHEEAA